MNKIPAELRAAVARNIRACRMERYPERGGSKKCAEAFGVSQQQWSLWERGKRFPDELRMKQIAKFFGKTVEFMRRDKRPGGKTALEAEAPIPQTAAELHRIAGLDYPPPASWKYPQPGSPESFFWLARHLVSLLETKGIRIDKQCLAYLAKLLKESTA